MGNERYYKAIADCIRKQAGHLADFVENNPDREKLDDLWANIFLAFTGIMGAVFQLGLPAQDMVELLMRIFCEDTRMEIMETLATWHNGGTR